MKKNPRNIYSTIIILFHLCPILILFFKFFSGILLVAVTSLASAQVRPPNYSPDAIPETSFTCEDKITGGYYADQEADCQLFHVCVQVSEYEVGPIFLTKVIGS